jgi:hypothetical protein
MSAIVLAGASLTDGSPSTKTRLAPLRLGIFYGYPSYVNGANGRPEVAAAAFEPYDVLVLGDGLEFDDVDASRQPKGAGREEHQRTRKIIELVHRHPRRTAVYGYVDLGNSQRLPMSELDRRVRLWAAMGAQGIFLDEAGYDFGVTRDRQNDIVRRVHALGLSAFLNAFEPDDLFGTAIVPLNSAGGGNPAGVAHALSRSDLFLLESFQVRLGRFADVHASAERTARAVRYRDRSGVRLAGVTTTARSEPYRLEMLDYAWWSAVLWNIDAFGWGEPDFGGSTNALPWRPRRSEEEDLGRRFLSPVIKTKQGYSRRTDSGTLMLDVEAHSAKFVPNAASSRWVGPLIAIHSSSSLAVIVTPPRG